LVGPWKKPFLRSYSISLVGVDRSERRPYSPGGAKELAIYTNKRNALEAKKLEVRSQKK